VLPPRSTSQILIGKINCHAATFYGSAAVHRVQWMTKELTVSAPKWPRWSVLIKKTFGERDEADFASDCICGRGWILFLDEAECRLWSRDFVAARKGILQPPRPELEAAPGFSVSND
jgi:hypothetical protein